MKVWRSTKTKIIYSSRKRERERGFGTLFRFLLVGTINNKKKVFAKTYTVYVYFLIFYRPSVKTPAILFTSKKNKNKKNDTQSVWKKKTETLRVVIRLLRVAVRGWRATTLSAGTPRNNVRTRRSYRSPRARVTGELRGTLHVPVTDDPRASHKSNRALTKYSPRHPRHGRIGIIIISCVMSVEFSTRMRLLKRSAQTFPDLSARTVPARREIYIVRLLFVVPRRE